MRETIATAMILTGLIGGCIVFLLNEQRRRARVWAADYVWWRERARACRAQCVRLATTDTQDWPAVFADLINAYVAQEDEAADRADRLANRAALRIPHYLREKFIEQARRDCEVTL